MLRGDDERDRRTEKKCGSSPIFFVNTMSSKRKANTQEMLAHETIQRASCTDTWATIEGSNSIQEEANAVNEILSVRDKKTLWHLNLRKIAANELLNSEPGRQSQKTGKILSPKGI